jgi:hypothetical protein
MRICIDTLGSSSIFQRFAFIYAPECGEISEHGYHIHMAETWRLRNTNDKFKDNGITASIGANTGWKEKHILLAGALLVTQRAHVHNEVELGSVARNGGLVR